MAISTSIKNTNTLINDKNYFAKLSIAVGVVIFSGVISSYLYYQFQKKGGVFFPGLLYTGATIIIFQLRSTTYSIKNLLMYYVLMNITYLAVWLLTMISSWFVYIGGIASAGTAAIVTFMLVDKFISNIKFNKLQLFLTGGFSFLLVDILYIASSQAFDTTPAGYIFKIKQSPDTLFLEIFVFWQAIVGMKLFLTLGKTSK